MYDFSLNYREVIPDQTVLDAWKEISVNTGGTQGTLQDIKVVERANGFCYGDSTKHHTRNRFIYWRISHDVLELVEHSLDVNLAGNRIRYKFVDTPILDGVSIHETQDNIIVLVPTVCSVHRLIFPHPDKYHRQDNILGTHPDLAAPSVFSEATAVEARDPSTFHFFTNTNTSSSQLPYLAASTLSIIDEDAIFVLAYSSGEILLVKQSRDGQIEPSELKSESIVPRFLSGLADKLRQKDKDGDVTVSVLLHTFGLETYALTLCRNGQLKFWSSSKAECVAVIDIVAETGDITRHQIQGAQNHILRKTTDGYDSECLLAVFMNFTTESQLHIFKPVVSGANIRLVRLNTLHSSQNDLIDFVLSTTRIWSIWRGKDGECEVNTSSLQSSSQWTRVILETIPDSSQPPSVDGETDPRQIYLQHICHPGRFPLHIISKALNIYKRTTIVSDTNLSVGLLKQQICMAVEEDIQTELKESVVSDEEYLECASYCWQRFYSCCVQYHIAGLKPLGLLLLPNNSGAVLLKKSMFSFLRPLDIFEHLVYNSDQMYKDQFGKHILSENTDITDDVMTVFKVVSYLDDQVNDAFSYTFEKEMSNLQFPDTVMANLLEKILNEMDSEFTDYVAELLDKCSDLYQAIHKVLELLRLENSVPIEAEPEYHPSVNHIFTSTLGVSFVAGCLRQQTRVRFTICRNLLLITNILMERKELEWGVLEAIRSVCTPEIVVLTQANYVMVWLSGLSAVMFLPTEASIQRLSCLKLNPVFNIRTNALNSVSLLELFIGSTGGYEARKAFSSVPHNEETLSQWNLSLLPYLNNLFQLIWPVSGSPTFAEWLLSCGQHLWLQQYVRLLNNWCEWNSCTHSFLLATSLLTTGENYKADALFQVAASGIFTDQFLAQRILSHSPDSDQVQAKVSYYLKVIHLFEVHKAYDCAINLASTALSCTTPDDPLAATLYSIKFKHHLALKNYEMAFDSLNSNPDPERKKDNLRDLVKKLLDEKKIDTLMSFSYGNLEELFCNIIFTRARASEPTNNVYYDFLYAYQVKRGPSFFRLASSIMYEQAFRLSQMDDFNTLERQVKCLLAAKCALDLCEEKFAYIVCPLEQPEEEDVLLFPKVGSGEPVETMTLRKQINVITLGDLKNKLLLAGAKLKLLRFDPKTYSDVTTTNELVVLLTAAGLYREALELCRSFELSNRNVFEALTKKCCILTKYNDTQRTIAWKWLMENDLQDLPANTKDTASAAWNLLESLIGQYEEDKMSLIHKIVAKQIIKMNMFLPHWLLASYKVRNAAELFALFHKNGRLEEAVDIACGYIMAALGHGKEYFGLSHSLQPTQPALCLPVRGFMTLIHELKIINEVNLEKPLLKEYEHLKEVFDTYLSVAQRTSSEMCIYKTTTVL